MLRCAWFWKIIEIEVVLLKWRLSSFQKKRLRVKNTELYWKRLDTKTFFYKKNGFFLMFFKTNIFLFFWNGEIIQYFSVNTEYILKMLLRFRKYSVFPVYYWKNAVEIQFDTLKRVLWEKKRGGNEKSAGGPFSFHFSMSFFSMSLNNTDVMLYYFRSNTGFFSIY